MKASVTLGLSAIAAAALLEAALVPGLLIGGAAILAPRFLSRLVRRSRPRADASLRQRNGPANGRAALIEAKAPPALPERLEIRQAILKTVTFRVIVTSLDFTTNYIVIGELAAAAGLSAFALVAGPLFYLAHEMGWSYFVPSGKDVELPALLPRAAEAPSDRPGLTINRALAKTITFRTVATVMDFTATYVVVGDAATAAALSAFGFVAGPFVYLGHEMLWDRYGASPGSLPNGSRALASASE